MQLTTHLSVTEIVATIAIVLNILVYTMKTMIPLRIFAIASNGLFAIYAGFNEIYPTLILNVILLPLNCVRLYQMVDLIRRIKEASGRSFDMTWLKPFMHKRSFKAGTSVFKKGEKADAMFIVTKGKFQLLESGIEVPVGSVVGELGMLAPGGLRTQTLISGTAGEMMAIKYTEFEQLYFQNPQFGLYFLQLTAKRLFENIGALETRFAAQDILPSTKSTAHTA